jgi:hypothetical protein
MDWIKGKKGTCCLAALCWIVLSVLWERFEISIISYSMILTSFCLLFTVL